MGIEPKSLFHCATLQINLFFFFFNGGLLKHGDRTHGQELLPLKSTYSNNRNLQNILPYFTKIIIIENNYK